MNFAVSYNITEVIKLLTIHTREMSLEIPIALKSGVDFEVGKFETLPRDFCGKCFILNLVEVNCNRLESLETYIYQLPFLRLLKTTQLPM